MKWFSLLYQGELHPSNGDKVIPASDYGTLVSAIQVLEKAKEDKKRLEEETQQECANLRQEASKEGFQEGLAGLNERFLELDTLLKVLRQEMMQMVIPIALKAAKRIVAKELETFPETIVEIVLQALSPLSASQRITIFVHKQDKEHLEKQKPRLKEALERVEILNIQDKSDLLPGECLIQTEKGMVNTTFDNQFRAFELAFEKYSQST